MTANERHFKRDAWISARHRTWGYNCPAMDLDFVLVEYDNAAPAALIDYRHENGTIDLESIGARVLTNLGDMAGIPAYIVQYGFTSYCNDLLWAEPAGDPWFRIHALNIDAHAHMPDDDYDGSENAYVAWLYRLRGRPAPVLGWRIG